MIENYVPSYKNAPRGCAPQKENRISAFCQKSGSLFLAGPAGFEPSSAGVKVLCLTAWRWPNGFHNTNACLLYPITAKKAIALPFKSTKIPHSAKALIQLTYPIENIIIEESAEVPHKE